VLGFDPLHRPRGGRAIGYVEGERDSADLAGDAGEARFVPIEQDNARPVADEARGGSLPEAAGAAADDGNASVEVQPHESLAADLDAPSMAS
jgi:hypothetical protein